MDVGRDPRHRALTTPWLLRTVAEHPERGQLLFGRSRFGPETAYCSMCLRVYRDKPGRGGPARRFCGAPCRQRAADARRRGRPAVHASCGACGTEFLSLTPACEGGRGRVLCPPPWPASWWGTSPCAQDRRRELNRKAQARRRARLAAVPADG